MSRSEEISVSVVTQRLGRVGRAGAKGAAAPTSGVPRLPSPCVGINPGPDLVSRRRESVGEGDRPDFGFENRLEWIPALAQAPRRRNWYRQNAWVAKGLGQGGQAVKATRSARRAIRMGFATATTAMLIFGLSPAGLRSHIRQPRMPYKDRRILPGRLEGLHRAEQHQPDCSNPNIRPDQRPVGMR